MPPTVAMARRENMRVRKWLGKSWEYEVFSIPTREDTRFPSCGAMMADIRKTRGAFKLASFVYYIDRDLVFQSNQHRYKVQKANVLARWKPAP
jgi:hypothetical protein